MSEFGTAGKECMAGSRKEKGHGVCRGLWVESDLDGVY
jgi:hypothetical protein